ncbi:hypothetical protein FC89_GL000175 [Liquorilactobacillus ghanensis DSM 18630]|uniref:Uncharacterized protein n=1 Tax=Liquorilactobacillus ghanensis DSM 18630 TaxID=1423750 RepID=A0A0R1VQK1_9LACO|nr:hypothetical protein FC89_GL000175 [Liquorilactobacillus ghanensis DSM 18630]
MPMFVAEKKTNKPMKNRFYKYFLSSTKYYRTEINELADMYLAENVIQFFWGGAF